MNRDVRQAKPAARFVLAQLWSRLFKHPLQRIFDVLQLEKEKLLSRIFLGNEAGRWVYNRTDANWWTGLRLKTCWIPPLLILLNHSLTACLTSAAIWSTDIVDGWFARTKQQESDAGMRFETTVDTVFKLLMFGAVFLRYQEMRWLIGAAGGLELIRIGGALYMIWNGFTPKPNSSGRCKTWFYVAGIGLLLLSHGALADYLITGGIALSGYSMLMHWLEYQAWRRTQTHTRH